MAFKYPWTNLHELNLDWILGQIRQITKQIANFTGLTASAHSLPANADPTVTLTGGSGNTPYNFDFGLPSAPTSTVSTVNGQSGDVVITASDIGLGNVDNVQQYSATNPPPYPVTSVNGQTGAVTVTAPVTSVNGMTGDVIVSGGGGSGDVLSVNGKNGVVVLDKTDIGLGNVDNVQQYSATNPPPYPVTSVNGLTGAVTLGDLVDCKNDLTAVADVTINSAEYVKIGHLITYRVSITANSIISASTEVFNGLIQPIETMSAGFTIASGIVIPITSARNSGTGNGYVVFQNSLPAGGRTITFSYITQS